MKTASGRLAVTLRLSLRENSERASGSQARLEKALVTLEATWSKLPLPFSAAKGGMPPAPIKPTRPIPSRTLIVIYLWQRQRLGPFLLPILRQRPMASPSSGMAATASNKTRHRESTSRNSIDVSINITCAACA